MFSCFHATIVIGHEADMPFVVAVIVVVPTLTPVTTPDATEATDGFVLAHTNDVLEAVEGKIVGASVTVEPTFKEDTRNVTEDTGVTTVTVELALLNPSTVVAVIVTTPLLFPLTCPF